MLAQETTTAETSEPPQGQPSLRPLPHKSELSEADFIRSALEIAQAHSLDIAANDLAFLHLATSVRPLVLFTGAPGIGKTSLALFYAALLGCTPANRACVFAPVQANWISDDPLFGDDGCLTPILRQGELQPDLLQVIVFDEFNLSRPEYYLSRLLTALDYEIRIAGHALPRLSEVHGHRLFVYATLNIDEVARPPSDKILDRAFVLSPTPPEVRDDALLTRPRSFVPDYRISAEQWARWASLPAPTALPADLLALVRIFNDFERTSTATHFETVTPSRRALLDLAQIEQRFHVASLDSLGVSRNGLLDPFFHFPPPIHGRRNAFPIHPEIKFAFLQLACESLCKVNVLARI